MNSKILVENEILVKDFLDQMTSYDSVDKNYIEVKQDFNYDSQNEEYSDNSYALFLKNILAFGNTPRQRSSFLIYGVAIENGTNNYLLTGTKNFPPKSKLFELISDSTNIPLKCISINDNFYYQNKYFPYIGIDISEDGPFYLTKKKIKSKIIKEGEIYLRDLGNSVVAEGFQMKLMNEDWESWIVDELYFSNAKIIIEKFKKKFKKLKLIKEFDDYVKMIYETEMKNSEFDTMTKVVSLVHVYPTLNFLQDNCSVELINDPDFYSCQMRFIVGSNFHSNLLHYTKINNFECLKIQNLFFVNDSYAKYSKAYIESFKKELNESEIGKIIDLNYHINGKNLLSIIEFLYSKLKDGIDDTIIVKGDLGTGKSITAKYLTYLICEQYLKHPNTSIKAVYINLNNYNIKATQNEILYPIFENYESLNVTDKQNLINEINEDEIYQIIDSVDEMNFQFGDKGFEQLNKFLNAFINNISTIFFLRSTYFKNNKQMLEHLTSLKYRTNSYSEDEENIFIVELCPYDKGQLERIFNSHFSELDGSEELFSQIANSNLGPLMNDPLLFYYIIHFIKKEFEILPKILEINFDNSRLSIIDFMIKQILEREFTKRKRQDLVSGNFMREFEKFINMSAYKVLVLENKRSFSLSDWDEFINNSIGKGQFSSKVEKDELAAAFRTMAWIKRNDENNTFAFRHETLNYLCAAKHLNTSLNLSSPIDDLFINELFQNQTSFYQLIFYSSQIYSKEQLNNFILLLASTSNDKISLLIRKIITDRNRSEDFFKYDSNKKEQISANTNLLISIIKVISTYPELFDFIFPIIKNALTPHRKIHLLLPLLYIYNSKISPRNKIEKYVFYLLEEFRLSSMDWFQSGYKFSIKDQVMHIKEHSEECYDKQIGKMIDFKIQDTFSYDSYKNIFSLDESFCMDKIDLKKYFKKSKDYYHTWLIRSTGIKLN